jgi:hypothetical protein
MHITEQVDKVAEYYNPVLGFLLCIGQRNQQVNKLMASNTQVKAYARPS